MRHSDIGFPPIKIDSGDNIHIITGVSGELLKIDKNLQPIGEFSVPFPSSISSSAILGEKWIGTWIESELRQARMAAFDINQEWLDGGSKADLRSNKGKSVLHPKSNTWSQSLDAEPMGLSEINNTLCFSSRNRGIYRINSDSEVIWKTDFPKWEGIEEAQDKIVGFTETTEGLVLVSHAGGIAIYDENGILIEKKILKLPELITGFSYDNELGWFIRLNGKCFAIMDSIRNLPKIYHCKGPIYDVKIRNHNWIWTGWRHDGVITGGLISTASRNDIGVGIIGDNVLTNDGKWDGIRI
jgi:hypothetical protein